jgi:SAM-dependent methyltransferase
MKEEKTFDPRARVGELADEFIRKGQPTGWFEALYKEAAGNAQAIPWADLEPNKAFRAWAEKTNLQGDGRRALVVGCGLGDDAKFLADLGFEVTAFDISETAIEWAKKIHADKPIEFVAADLFSPPAEWREAFEFVLEIHTIQPLPLEMRPDVIKSIAAFVAPNGKMVVVCRGREDDEPVNAAPPWALSKSDLANFEKGGLRQIGFTDTFDEEEPPVRRFVVEYTR